MNILRDLNLKLLFLVVFFSFASCETEKAIEAIPIRPVAFQEVTFSGANNVRTFSGTAQTDKIINLSFRNNGIITTFDLKLGQSVKKGQLLGMLDNVQSRLSYESTIASLNSAASQMNTAKLSLNRIRSLYEKGSSSLSDYEAIKNSYRTAVASHESVKRSVAIQEEKIRYGYLYAPEDGVIAQIHVEMDENVNTGQRIAVLNAGTDMEISLGLPENIINLVQQNMSVKVTFSSLANLVFDGVISEVSPAVSQSSAIYPIRVRIVKPTNDIKSGMAADVTFNFRKTTESENVIVIPAKAVGEDAQGNFVFVIEKDGNGSTIVKRQMVSVGKLSSQGFEIIEGLFIGQKIAVAGLQTLLEGQEVKMNVRSGLPEDR